MMTTDFKVRQVKSAIAFLAGGIGVLVLSLSHVLADLTGGPPGPVGKALTLHQGIGPYSGKQTVAVLVWLISWYVLYKMFANKDIEEGKIIRWTVILYVLATLLIFPPFLAML